MEFKVNQIVKNKRGNYGFIAGFNGKPCLVVYEAYTVALTRFDENLNFKNKPSDYEYNITHIWDGEKMESYKDVWKASFKPEKFELECVFDREKE